MHPTTDQQREGEKVLVDVVGTRKREYRSVLMCCLHDQPFFCINGATTEVQTGIAKGIGLFKMDFNGP